MAETSTRDIFLDIVKGVGIFLVVFGHCIQYGNGSINFFEDYVFRLIYSFHMPLFMLISGYLFQKTYKKYNNFSVLKKLFATLVIPALAWNIVTQLITQHFSFGTLLGGSWFLWAIFYCALLLCIVEYVQLPKLASLSIIGSSTFRVEPIYIG